MLLDIHPEPEDARVEVHAGDGILIAGRPDQSAYHENVRVARTELGKIIREGVFALEESTVFELLDPFEGLDDWLEYMRDYESNVPLDPALAARTRELLDRTGGRLKVRLRVWGSRLRRLEPGIAGTTTQ